MSPRPLRRRRISYQPDVTYFKPAGVPMNSLEEVVLTMDEVEALRLCDVKKSDQKKCAEKMSVSQPTFSRILDSARKKIADAVVNGKAIRAKGGEVKVVKPRGRRYRAPLGGRGRKRGSKSAGPEGFCVCPKCGTKVKHKTGVPCYTLSCPNCETPMTRE